MAYGKSQYFIRSRDLRYPLADDSSEKSKDILHKACSYDSLISINDKDNYINYDSAFLSRQDERLQNLKKADSAFSGIHCKSTAILCGGGWSYNKSLVSKAYEKGAIVIALGSGIRNNMYAQYWVGSQSPVSYTTDVLSKSNLIRFVKESFASDRYFDARSMTFRGNPVHEYPGTVVVPDEDIDYEHLSAGIDCSLYRALLLCARLGITDVLLTGVDLCPKPVTGEWYGNDIVLSPKQKREKQEKYLKVVEDFNTRLLPLLREQCFMRVYADAAGSDTLNVPLLDMQITLRALQLNNAANVGYNSLTRPELSMSDRIELAKIVEELESSKISPDNIIMHSRKLIERVPHIFNIGVVVTNTEKYEQYMKKPTGCTSCTRKNLGGQTYRLFAQGLQGKYKKDLLAFWKEELSDYKCLKDPQGNYIILDSYADLKNKYAQLKNKL